MELDGELAVFIRRKGVIRVSPAVDGGLGEVDAALRLYEDLREVIARFDRAIREKTALNEKPRKTMVLS